MKLFQFYFIIIICSLVACKNVPTEDTSIPLPYYNGADFTPEWVDKDDPYFQKIHQIAPFNFTNQTGESVTNATFEGHIYVADFFFTTCPGICPKLTTSMLQLQDAFESDKNIKLLSHTVTPWIDSVEKLKQYADNVGVTKGKWHLVTGEQDELYTIARRSYFADMDINKEKSVDDFLHTENFILVDQKGRIRGVYNGTLELDVQRLIEDIKTLKKLG